MAFKHKGYNKHGWPFKDETDHEKHHNMNENRDGNDAEGKPLKSGFKMKGSPMKRNFGIGAESPIKQTTTTDPSYSGINFDGGNSYSTGDGTKIPGFRDFVSLEQQQAYADKVDARRADKKDKTEFKTPEEINKSIQGINIGDNEATDKSMGFRQVNGKWSKVERGGIDPESLGDGVDRHGNKTTYNTSSRPYTELEYGNDGELIEDSKYVTKDPNKGGFNVGSTAGSYGI